MVYKRDDESYREYKERVLDSVSRSFCASKWYNATIWLHLQKTVSCPLPKPHDFDVEEVIKNPSSFHNTSQKKEARQQMLDGVRPEECSICWRIEDNEHSTVVSDRPMKSAIFKEEDIKFASEQPADWDAPLKTLEIAFDSYCNFKCTYCNATYSTSWASDLRRHGPYENLTADGMQAYGRDGKNIPSGPHGSVITAFHKWWDEELRHNLQELRITGGEPLTSPDFWTFIAMMNATPPNPDMTVSINTNLSKTDGYSNEDFQSLISKIPRLHIYTSCEAMDRQAEYIRSGMKFEEWKKNFDFVAKKNAEFVRVTMTIGALSAPSLIQFMRFMQDKKWLHRNNTKIRMSFTILEYPDFMNIHVLPRSMVLKLRDELIEFQEWIEIAKEPFSGYEHAGLERLITYLDKEPTQDRKVLEKSFKSFFTQHDKRRNITNAVGFVEVFPELAEWYKSLDISDINQGTQYEL